MDDNRELSYEAAGGEEKLRCLTRLFDEGVAADPALRAVYPSKDLGPDEEQLRLFLIEYWGGPATYNELRGHPRLRMRHRHFAIGEAERDAWLRHMRAALEQIGQVARPPRPALGHPDRGREQPDQRAHRAGPARPGAQPRVPRPSPGSRPDHPRVSLR